jgi:hypothetical protein
MQAEHISFVQEIAEESDSIRELLRSPGWFLMRRRVEELLEQSKFLLEETQPEMSTAEARGRIRALRQVLLLPEVLLQEQRSQRKGRSA